MDNKKLALTKTGKLILYSYGVRTSNYFLVKFKRISFHCSCFIRPTCIVFSVHCPHVLLASVSRFIMYFINYKYLEIT